jgi:hypothetical protein
VERNWQRAHAVRRTLQYRTAILAMLCAATSCSLGAAQSTARPTVLSNATSGARTKVVGNPLAAGMVRLLVTEIKGSIKRRNLDARWQRFRAYAADQLESSAGEVTGSELTGNCRLSWYDELLRDPIESVRAAELFTRQLHQDLSGDHIGLRRALATAAAKLDLPKRNYRDVAAIDSPDRALDEVRRALANAHREFAQAVSPLTRRELAALRKQLPPVLVSEPRFGHTLENRGTGRWLCDLMEKIDRDALHAAAESLAPLTNPGLLDQLASLPANATEKVAGVTGPVARSIHTESGVILIGGGEKNSYQLDALTDVVAVIDLGGDDTYLEGAVTAQRPVLVIVDLDGNDQYQGSKPGIQGGAILGVSMLIDVKGDDAYRAGNVAQGSTIVGAGMLFDLAGDDTYLGVRRVQGHAIAGVGLLVDRDGNDRYHGAMWTQGFGGPLGFAVLADQAGRDSYYTGGLYLDNYDETPGYEGWGQGVGAGIRSVASGGIGVILDGGGDDSYQYDYISHGGGYWCGLGFARDFGGNDKRLGATQKMHQGQQRGQQSFQRFSNGWGCHYAAGFLFDDQGDDLYHGTIMGLGFAWDCAVGFLCDFAGADRYTATGSRTQGNGAQMGLGVIFDYGGDDQYAGNGQGYAAPGLTYHPYYQSGGNFSFVIDYGGADEYGCGAQNNAFTQRGDTSGFIIDRPTKAEADAAKREAAGP